MKVRLAILWLVSASGVCGSAAEQVAESPYKGQETRSIKALSAEDAEALLDGRGMGFAKAAELNGYPGPKHVLELAEPLELSDAQQWEVRRSFEAMQDRARQLGREIVEAERQLDAAFAEGAIDATRLEALVGAIAELSGRLRATHLAAHLETRELLTLRQRHRYSELRGYADGQHHTGH